MVPFRSIVTFSSSPPRKETDFTISANVSIFCAINGGDQITALDSGLFGSTSRLHLSDARLIHRNANEGKHAGKNQN